jgi:hypothetical protein
LIESAGSARGGAGAEERSPIFSSGCLRGLN